MKAIEDLPVITGSDLGSGNYSLEPRCAARITAPNQRNIYWVYGRLELDNVRYVLVRENPNTNPVCIPVQEIIKFEGLRIV